VGRLKQNGKQRGANLIKLTDVTDDKSLEMLKAYSRDAEAGAEIDWEQYRCSAQAS